MSRLTDFGVAKAAARATVTKQGSVKGKLGYLAPEQLRAVPSIGGVDMFAAGAVLWEGLRAGGRSAEHGRGHDRQDPHRADLSPVEFRADVPTELDAIVLRALARDPDERFDGRRAGAGARGGRPRSLWDGGRGVGRDGGRARARRATQRRCGGAGNRCHGGLGCRRD